MASFDIGWASEGWMRGNPLGIINNRFVCGDVAALCYKAQSPFGAEIPEIGAIQFTRSEVSKVNAWLDWWYDREVTA